MEKTTRKPARCTASSDGGTKTARSTAADVFGLPIFKGSVSECRHRLAAFLRAPRSTPALVFTPNLEMLATAKSAPKIHAMLRSANLLLPDGIGVLLLSKGRVKERIPGIEAGEFLLSHAASRGDRVFLLGGAPGVAERAACALQRRHRGLRVVGTHHGYFESPEEAFVVKKIRASAPDLLIVCMGFPRQERFLTAHREDLPSLRLGIGLGGALDVWSGNTRRAPLSFRIFGLEWLYRILREPRRIPRLLGSACALIKKG